MKDGNGKNPTPATPEQLREERVARLKNAIDAHRNQAFNGERPKSPQRGVLSQQFRDAKNNKGGRDI